MHTRERYSSALQDMFKGLLDNMQMIWFTGQILNGASEQSLEILIRNPAIPESLQLYEVGSSKDAIGAIKNWIDKYVIEYLKIYDPYFTPEDLSLIRTISPETRIYIMSLRKSQVDRLDDAKVIESYQSIFSDIFAIDYPDIHFYIFGTKPLGDGPIHDRYYITSNGRGIQIGTSISGLGKKDSVIRTMGVNETIAIEANFVDKMLVSPPFYYEDERLRILTFTLRR